MLSMNTVQDQWFSGICLDGVRQRPPRALLTTHFLTFNQPRSGLNSSLFVNSHSNSEIWKLLRLE